MRQIYNVIYIALVVLLSVTVCNATTLKVYVAPFNAIGAVKNKEESKVLLQALLTAKLSDGTILPVNSLVDADVTAQGTFVVIGNQYSLDIVLLNKDNKALSRRVASGISDAPSYFNILDSVVNELKKDLSRVPVQDNKPKERNNQIGIVRPEKEQNAQGDVIYSKSEMNGSNKVLIPRMVGEYSLIRNVEPLDLMLLADMKTIKLINVKNNSIVSNAQLDVGSQIINIDYLTTESKSTNILVSYVRMSKVYTAIYAFDGKTLIRMKDQEPYYSRVFTPHGNERKLLVQEQGAADTPYYGPVYTANLINNKIVKGSEFPLPAGITIYEFNQFKGMDNTSFTVAYDNNGYLSVFDNALKSVWKSSEKFGKSQLSYQIYDLNYLNQTGKEYRTYFVNQRVLVTKNQIIIVGYNDPSLSFGDMRSYKKGTVYGFKWNGESLEEVWHTVPTQNYMPDFEYDDESASLYQLQRTQGEGLFQSQAGTSTVLIKKVE